MQELTHLEIIPQKVERIMIGLHGYGSDANDMLGLGMQFRDILKNTAIISVNAPKDCETNMGGYQWFSLKTMNLFSILKEIKISAKLLNNFIDTQLKRFNLTEKDLILYGFSQGAMMSLYTSLRRKMPLLAVLSFSGMLPDTVDSLKKEIQSKPKIFMTNGTEDRIVPYTDLERTLSVLREFDINVESHSIQGMEHMINDECINLARKFLKELKIILI